MTTRFKMRRLACGLFALAVAGCSSEPSSYYLLSAMPAPETPIRSDVAKQLAVGVGPISLPAYLDRPQLVTRTSPNRLNLAEFERWAEPLHDTFSQALAENISSLVGTDLVYVLPRRDTPALDYQVPVEVFRFDRNAEGQVKLLARWSIFTDEPSKPLLIRRLLIREPTPPDSGTEEVIVALSRAVESLAREIARDLQGLAGQAALTGYDLASIQNALRSRGFDPGPSDGLMGPRTRAAIRRYQAARDVQVTGEPSRQLQTLLTRTP